MALTQRKQVLKADDQISEAISEVNAPQSAISGAMHGLTKDLTINGTGFEDKPICTILPKITGNQQVGQTLTCVPATFVSQRPMPPAVTRKWKNNGVDIGGATALTYVLQAGDAGDLITVEETATDDLGHAGTGLSAATGAIAP